MHKLQMRNLFVFVVLFVFSFSTFAVNVIDVVNNHPLAQWQAGETFVSSLSKEEFRSMLIPSDMMPHGGQPLQDRFGPVGASTGIPENFDGREAFGSCIHPVRDQGHCGSCWAFSASEVLSDRVCIASDHEVDVVLSPQQLVSCEYNEDACEGGIPPYTWAYLSQVGIVSDNCIPYVSGADADVPSCPNSCTGTGNWTHYYSIAQNSRFDDLQDVQWDVMTNGPIEITMDVYEDFKHYTTGVYHHVYGDLEGGHAIKLVGWGVEDGLPYWLAQNSWNTQWGEDGYFKILRGVNECNVEKGFITGYADMGKQRIVYMSPSYGSKDDSHNIVVVGTKLMGLNDVTSVKLGDTEVNINSQYYNPRGVMINVFSSEGGNSGSGNVTDGTGKVLLELPPFTAMNYTTDWAEFFDPYGDGLLYIEYDSDTEHLPDLIFQINQRVAWYGFEWKGAYSYGTWSGYTNPKVHQTIYLGGSAYVVEGTVPPVSVSGTVDVVVESASLGTTTLLNGYHFLDNSAPSTPGKPYSTSVSSSSVDLEWTAPV